MKTGEIAKILGLDVSTVRKWIDTSNFSRFFSPSARGEHGNAHRFLTESDVLVLNTIRTLRTRDHADWDAIVAYLDSGQREQEFPENAISVDIRTIPVPQAEQAARTLAMMAERDAALQKVNELNDYVKRLEQEREELRERLTREKEQVKEQLMREIMELMLKIGRLEGRLEQIVKDDEAE